MNDHTARVIRVQSDADEEGLRVEVTVYRGRSSWQPTPDAEDVPIAIRDALRAWLDEAAR